MFCESVAFVPLFQLCTLHVLQRKRPAFDKLLSRVVLEKGIDGSTQLRLTAAP